MATYTASVEMGHGDDAAVDPTGFVIRHHRSEAARVEMSMPSCGHFLHAAVAMCIYNDALAVAADRGMEISDLRVTADGGFTGDPFYVSTGITFSIEIDSPADRHDIERLIADVIDDAAIPRSIQQGTNVQLGDVTLGARR